MKKICSILAVIILAATVAFIGYDRYQLNKPIEYVVNAKNTNINIIVKGQYDDGDLRTTVKVKNGWFKPQVFNFLYMLEPYNKFITVYYEDEDDNVVCTEVFALRDFVEDSENGVFIAKKTKELNEKKRRKIKHSHIGYLGLHVKGLVK